MIYNYLIPDGIFIFDMNTPYKFENIYADNSYILESENEDGRLVFCGWQNQYDEVSGICDFYLSLFEEDDDGAYVRSDEHQRERCYTSEELTSLLKKTGFEPLCVCSDFDFAEPVSDTVRYYIIAKAKK